MCSLKYIIFFPFSNREKQLQEYISHITGEIVQVLKTQIHRRDALNILVDSRKECPAVMKFESGELHAARASMER